jgi:hypothetical protein
MNLKANLEATEVVVEWQDPLKKEINFDNIGSLEDQCGDRCLVVWRRRWVKKQTQDSVESQQKFSTTTPTSHPGKDCYAAPSLNCEWEMFVRVQAGTALEEETRQ